MLNGFWILNVVFIQSRYRSTYDAAPLPPSRHAGGKLAVTDANLVLGTFPAMSPLILHGRDMYLSIVGWLHGSYNTAFWAI